MFSGGFKMSQALMKLSEAFIQHSETILETFIKLNE